MNSQNVSGFLRDTWFFLFIFISKIYDQSKRLYVRCRSIFMKYLHNRRKKIKKNNKHALEMIMNKWKLSLWIYIIIWIPEFFLKCIICMQSDVSGMICKGFDNFKNSKYLWKQSVEYVSYSMCICMWRHCTLS